MDKRHPIIDARAERVRKALEAGGYDPDCPGDIICDLLHFCDVEGLDFDLIVENGRSNYDSETGEGDDIEQDSRRMFAENGNKL